MQNQRKTLAVREFRDRSADSVLPFELVRRVRRFVCRPPAAVGIQRQRRTPGLPAVVPTQIRNDPIKPRRELRSRLIRARPLEHTHESVLADVLGGLTPTQKPHGQAEYPLLVPADQRRQGGTFAAGDTLHQSMVAEILVLRLVGPGGHNAGVVLSHT